ncbi:MAG TPA: dihydroxy-acid dehydratase [Labilithrix sp.]|jgi:hypothetical protein|nr:dihydroxy-acid dehydratase [Labilithrix sp.]
MFTANSINCLTEALGLSLPGKGTSLATHSDREQLPRAQRTSPFGEWSQFGPESTSTPLASAVVLLPRFCGHQTRLGMSWDEGVHGNEEEANVVHVGVQGRALEQSSQRL